MDKINFKNKQFDVIKQLGNKTYLVNVKNKKFVVKQFVEGTNQFPYFLSHAKILKIAGINIPKIVKIDKKNQKVMMEYIDGENVFDTLIKHDLDGDYYSAIFEQSWYGDNEKITLDFHPDKWIMSKDKKLYYLGFDYVDGLSAETEFKTIMIKFWFFTKEFFNYASSLGYEVDRSRLKEEYVINKEIVLTVVKYYI